MFLVAVKTLLVEALATTFDEQYPDERFRGIWVGPEYPMAKASYPGIWVDFTPATDLQVAGIGHVEYTQTDAGVHRVLRWRYSGMVQLTCVALTSLERDGLVDELVKVLAFGRDDVARAALRLRVEHNDLIGMVIQWDKLDLTGKAETPGTPWGTDEVLYEQTVALDCQGEFVSDGSTSTLVPLSSVMVYDTASGEAPPPGTAGGGWL